MVIGRSSTGAIKIKTDEAGGGLRAVNCACCGSSPTEFYYEFIDENCPFESYWTASARFTVLSDQSVLYEADFSSAFNFGIWSKTGAPGEPINFEGTYTDDFGNMGDAVMSLQSNSPECGGVRLNFNVSDFYAGCDFSSIPVQIFSCEL